MEVNILDTISRDVRGDREKGTKYTETGFITFITLIFLFYLTNISLYIV
jgi:hypothetical protein